MTQRPDRRVSDLRGLLGMQTSAARWIVAFYSFSFVLLAFSSREGIAPLWPVCIALVVATASAITLITVDGDPLPLRYTIPLTASGPVNLAIMTAVVPVPITSGGQMWPGAAATALYTFMCVRGRTQAAWTGLLGMFVVSIVWSSSTGQGFGTGITLQIVNAAPLAMATFFAMTLRPAAREIFELRERSTRKAAAEAAADAILSERDLQLDRLDELARPILERVARGGALAASDVLACALLEAHLRDTLRAPALAASGVAAAARSARSRGVDVALLDDRGADDADQADRERLLDAIAADLIAVTSGSATVRILPPGRSSLATVLVTSAQSTTRIEYGSDGRPVHRAFG